MMILDELTAKIPGCLLHPPPSFSKNDASVFLAAVNTYMAIQYTQQAVNRTKAIRPLTRYRYSRDLSRLQGELYAYCNALSIYCRIKVRYPFPPGFGMEHTIGIWTANVTDYCEKGWHQVSD